MKKWFNKKLYQFAEWFFYKVYDEPSYEELENKCYSLESRIDELESDVDYWRDAYEHNRRRF